MRKKVLTIMFVGISAVLAIVASNRMSVNAIISENVEALSWMDGDDDDDVVRVEIGEEPKEGGAHWGPRYSNGNLRYKGMPKCNKPYEELDHGRKLYCWTD